MHSPALAVYSQPDLSQYHKSAVAIDDSKEEEDSSMELPCQPWIFFNAGSLYFCLSTKLLDYERF